ncbi:PAS domain S-box-containing protein [Mucilaginibacter pineti]|uniref:histidine kinase n=1 Tax=Mucilaginibacter pineti TaxID=1391627 RepID=A0A1G7LDZ0_9SPHI|nr:GAF domain-containing protein [Mucilaginibacter pineti]SDF47611.1 PAS domain S-box-containing protein [Mucilaginibacter pineti]
MPLKELERLAAVNRFLKLEISKEKELQEIVELAAQICGTPTALITLIDQDTQHIKFKVGFDPDKTSRKEAFCSHVIKQQDVMVVADAREDERFAFNPLVTGGPKIRFYAGAPLTTGDGQHLGSLCVIDQQPRALSPTQQQMLRALAKQVIQLLEFDTSLQILKQQYVAARESEIKLRSFFESESSCHLLIGRELEALAFNKALADFVQTIFGVRIATGMKVTDYINGGYVKEFIKNYKLAFLGQPVKLKRKLEYPGRAIWWYFSFDPARNQDGEIIGVSYNATDVTQLVQQEEKVLAQNRSLEEIAWIQSHELRRPVASIMGVMNVIKEGAYQAEREDLEMLEKAVLELDERIKQMARISENNA